MSREGPSHFSGDNTDTAEIKLNLEKGNISVNIFK